MPRPAAGGNDQKPIPKRLRKNQRKNRTKIVPVTLEDAQKAVDGVTNAARKKILQAVVDELEVRRARRENRRARIALAERENPKYRRLELPDEPPHGLLLPADARVGDILWVSDKRCYILEDGFLNRVL